MSDIGLEGWVSAGDGSPDDWVESVNAWKALGATHISFNTMNSGLTSPKDHVETITRFKEAVARIE